MGLKWRFGHVSRITESRMTKTVYGRIQGRNKRGKAKSLGTRNKGVRR